MIQPLTGIRVLDFSTLLPGPLASLFLAEAGADVLKIERPGGEDMRRFGPFVEKESAPFAVLNGGKQVLSLDLKAPEAKSILRPLIEGADILIEQFRPGVMARLGLGYEDVKAINPRLIYCAISGYGQKGPRAMEAGHDLNYQALGGLLSLAPGTPQAPSVPPALTADIAGGAMPAVLNILLALRQRDLTGQGCFLDIAMADIAFTFSWLALARGHATGRYPQGRDDLLSGGSPRYQLYVTRDEKFVAVGALEQKFWQTFCDVIGLDPALADDRINPDATGEAITAIIASRDAAEWRGILEPADCCATVVRSLEEAITDPHFRARGLFDYRVGAGGRDMPLTPVPVAPAFRKPPAHKRVTPDAG